MGIFHGWESMCSPVAVEFIVKEKVVTFDKPEVLSFELGIQNIPRMARLCFTLFSIVDKRANRKTMANPAQPTVKHGKTVLMPS